MTFKSHFFMALSQTVLQFFTLRNFAQLDFAHFHFCSEQENVLLTHAAASLHIVGTVGRNKTVSLKLESILARDSPFKLAQLFRCFQEVEFPGKGEEHHVHLGRESILGLDSK
jgi:hypothetical protein